MTDRIIREDFSAAKHIPEFANFDCGDEDYQLAVSDWIKGINPDDSVLTDIAKYDTKVWAYYNHADDLIGFASLGLTNWSLWPPAGKKKVPVVVIPNIAVAKAFWGIPEDDPYADQIMDDVAAEALRYADERRALVLCVRPENKRAIKFYERSGFTLIEPPMRDGHLRMGRELTP